MEKRLYNLPVKTAARLLGTSPQWVRIQLQRGRLPYGEVIQLNENGKRMRYRINPRKFAEHEMIPYEEVLEEATKDMEEPA